MQGEGMVRSWELTASGVTKTYGVPNIQIMYDTQVVNVDYINA